MLTAVKHSHLLVGSTKVANKPEGENSSSSACWVPSTAPGERPASRAQMSAQSR